MKTSHVAIASMFCLGCVSLVSADVIHDNGTPDLLNAYHSDFDTSSPSDTVQVGDDFILTVNVVLRDVHWWGAYAFENTPPAEHNFTIRIFEMPGGVPNMVPLHEVVVGDVGRTDTGDDVAEFFDLYAYSAVLPDIALGPGQYLLSIVNDTTGEPDDWFWAESSTEGNDWERDSDDLPWVPHTETVELAFNLTEGCPWDFNGDGRVGTADLLKLLSNWGPCP